MDIEVKLVHDISEIRCQGLVEPHIPLFSLMQSIIYMASPLSGGGNARRDNVDINSQPKWLICKSLNIPQSSRFFFCSTYTFQRIRFKSNQTELKIKQRGDGTCGYNKTDLTTNSLKVWLESKACQQYYLSCNTSSPAICDAGAGKFSRAVNGLTEPLPRDTRAS